MFIVSACPIMSHSARVRQTSAFKQHLVCDIRTETNRDAQRRTETNIDDQRHTKTNRHRQKQADTSTDKQERARTNRDRQRETKTNRERHIYRMTKMYLHRQTETNSEAILAQVLLKCSLGLCPTTALRQRNMHPPRARPCRTSTRRPPSCCNRRSSATRNLHGGW